MELRRIERKSTMIRTESAEKEFMKSSGGGRGRGAEGGGCRRRGRERGLRFVSAGHANLFCDINTMFLTGGSGEKEREREGRRKERGRKTQLGKVELE